MQLVVSGNRILAHGEGFLAMGGTVINTETGRVYQNATVVECDGCPADIDKVGYEYHAGQFIPCAPYGRGSGNLAVVCDGDCKAIKDSGLPLSDLFTVYAKFATGSYVGTGTYGASNPCSVTFDFVPKFFVVLGKNNECMFVHPQTGTITCFSVPSDRSIGNNCVVQVSGKTISWYTTAADDQVPAAHQGNVSDRTYHWYAIG